jgi:hypothetical protein
MSLFSMDAVATWLTTSSLRSALPSIELLKSVTSVDLHSSLLVFKGQNCLSPFVYEEAEPKRNNVTWLKIHTQEV